MRKTVATSLLLLLWLSVACRQTPPTPTPTATPTATTTPTPTPTSHAQAGLLTACPVNEQQRALREGVALAWEQLPLRACYDLWLDLRSIEEGTYEGKGVITFLNGSGAPLADIMLRLYPNADVIYGGALELLSVAVDGVNRSGEAILDDGTAWRIPLDTPLAPDSLHTLHVTFRGTLPVDFPADDIYGIFHLSRREPIAALANWYPMLAVWRNGAWDVRPVYAEGDAVVSLTSLYRVQVEHPPEWQIVSTGVALDETPTKKVLVSGPARDFTILASPAYRHHEQVVDGVRVHHWGFTDDTQLAESALRVAEDALRLFDERFGAYPYAELDAAAMPMQAAAGVEYPGLAIAAQNLYETEGGRRFLPVALAHEVAHQWWYAVVGSDVLAAPWQDEALTTFSSFLYFEVYDPSFYTQLLDVYRQRVEEFEARGAEPIAQPLAAFEGRGEAYGVVVYLKGALFFQALRERLGDDVFFAALQTYYREWQYRLAPPDALLNAFEEACACSLDAFYREWGVRQ